MPSDHARLGASSAHRWTACPGSIQLSEGIPNKETIYAAERVAAHKLGEICLNSKREPSSMIGQTIDGIVISEEMSEAVDLYISEVRRIQRPQDAVLFVEKRVSLEALDPPEEMFGTCEALL